MVIKELKEKTERPKCDDCVSRADVLKYKCDCYDAQNHLLYAVPTGHIMRLPSVTPERKMGKWNGYNADNPDWLRDDGSPVFLACSECHGMVMNNGSAHWNFCPSCGADMRGEQDGRDD